jgi:uncharacterized membrane protein (UPF0127 family)
MKTKHIIISILAALIIIASISILGNEKDWAEINGKRISIETARTARERAQGLMFREELCEDCGMLFIFQKEDLHSFWMKDTIIPIDIIFINKDLTIIDILSAEPCTTEPCPSYISKEKALYILETNQKVFSQEIIGKKIIIST